MSACQSTSPTDSRPAISSSEDPQDLLARALTATGERAALLRLQAAERYIELGEFDQAANLLAVIDAAYLREDDQVRFMRAYAKTLIEAENFVEASELLTSRQLDTWRDYVLIAQACAGLNNHSCAADGWIQASLTLGLGAAELPDDIHDTIWRHLSAARSGPQIFSHRYHHAWWALQKSVREAGSITGQLAAWQTWQRSNPSHPASIRPPEALRRLQTYQPPRMAVMLPLSGNLGDAGRAVRDGFVAAYLGEMSSQRPSIQFYDTGTRDVGAVWEDVLRGGHDVAIGPLIKPNVEKFAQLSMAAELPRLSLNYLPETDDNEGGLFQIGIAIEDEARSLVTHMLLEGHERVMIVHSQSPWSRRAERTFTEQWPYPITTSEFADIKGLTEAVGTAMLTADSEARKTEIQRLLGEELEFLPRARKDLDAIVALTSNVESQALVPALRFHFGDHLPVFATSQAVRLGKANPLEGFRMTELPLLAGDEYLPLNKSFRVATSNFAELYAFGYDAYRVGTWLPLIQTNSQLSLPGASGHLWLDESGTFRRELDLITLGAR